MPVIRERTQVFNQPVGVRRVSSGSEELWRTISSTASEISEVQFRKAAADAEKTGQKKGLAASSTNIATIDPETGEPVAYAAPEGYGSIAASAYQSMIDRRFNDSVEAEIKAKGAELSRSSANAGQYRDRMSQYVSSMYENGVDKDGNQTSYGRVIKEYGTDYVASTYSTLARKEVAAAKAALQKQQVITLYNEENSIKDMLAVGVDPKEIRIAISNRGQRIKALFESGSITPAKYTRLSESNKGLDGLASNSSLSGLVAGSTPESLSLLNRAVLRPTPENVSAAASALNTSPSVLADNIGNARRTNAATSIISGFNAISTIDDGIRASESIALVSSAIDSLGPTPKFSAISNLTEGYSREDTQEILLSSASTSIDSVGLTSDQADTIAQELQNTSLASIGSVRNIVSEDAFNMVNALDAEGRASLAKQILSDRTVTSRIEGEQEKVEDAAIIESQRQERIELALLEQELSEQVDGNASPDTIRATIRKITDENKRLLTGGLIPPNRFSAINGSISSANATLVSREADVKVTAALSSVSSNPTIQEVSKQIVGIDVDDQQKVILRAAASIADGAGITPNNADLLIVELQDSSLESFPVAKELLGTDAAEIIKLMEPETKVALATAIRSDNTAIEDVEANNEATIKRDEERNLELVQSGLDQVPTAAEVIASIADLNDKSQQSVLTDAAGRLIGSSTLSAINFDTVSNSLLNTSLEDVSSLEGLIGSDAVDVINLMDSGSRESLHKKLATMRSVATRIGESETKGEFNLILAGINSIKGPVDIQNIRTSIVASNVSESQKNTLRGDLRQKAVLIAGVAMAGIDANVESLSAFQSDLINGTKLGALINTPEGKIIKESFGMNQPATNSLFTTRISSLVKAAKKLNDDINISVVEIAIARGEPVPKEFIKLYDEELFGGLPVSPSVLNTDPNINKAFDGGIILPSVVASLEGALTSNNGESIQQAILFFERASTVRGVGDDGRVMNIDLARKVMSKEVYATYQSALVVARNEGGDPVVVMKGLLEYISNGANINVDITNDMGSDYSSMAAIVSPYDMSPSYQSQAKATLRVLKSRGVTINESVVDGVVKDMSRGFGDDPSVFGKRIGDRTEYARNLYFTRKEILDGREELADILEDSGVYDVLLNGGTVFDQQMSVFFDALGVNIIAESRALGQAAFGTGVDKQEESADRLRTRMRKATLAFEPVYRPKVFSFDSGKPEYDVGYIANGAFVPIMINGTPFTLSKGPENNNAVETRRALNNWLTAYNGNNLPKEKSDAHIQYLNTLPHITSEGMRELIPTLSDGRGNSFESIYGGIDEAISYYESLSK